MIPMLDRFLNVKRCQLFATLLNIEPIEHIVSDSERAIDTIRDVLEAHRLI